VLSFCLGGFSCLQASVNVIRPFAGLARVGPRKHVGCTLAQPGEYD